MLRVVASAVGGYTLGSIPFAVLLTRWRRGIDVRTQGSGHAGATNVLRSAGWFPALMVALLDLGKGFLAVKVVAGAGPITAGAAAVAVVLGHCWPIFAGFRGGMGVATAGGVLLALWPLGFVIAVGVDALLTLTLRHAARANVVTGLTLGPLLLLAGAAPATAVVAAATGLVVSLRSIGDWGRTYQELWLDRPQDDGAD